ncbi:MAG: hypothetical protein IJC55_03345 [Clostridia bacterium]|nr:hypothetical protein [Clostridia bacterium]
MKQKQNRVDSDMPNKLAMSRAQRIWAIVICVILAAALVVAGYFIIESYRNRERNAVYESPKAAAQAWFDAYEKQNYESELSCYPKEIREYLIESAGGEENYEATFLALAQYAYSGTEVVLGEVTDAPKTVLTSIDYYLKTADLDLEFEAVKLVYFTYESDLISSGETQQGEDNSTYVTTVKYGGNWYVFVG